jgi:endonuclease/exonuclease/phosphatase (EEP) superfamily protein YafD
MYSIIFSSMTFLIKKERKGKGASDHAPVVVDLAVAP